LNFLTYIKNTTEEPLYGEELGGGAVIVGCPLTHLLTIPQIIIMKSPIIIGKQLECLNIVISDGIKTQLRAMISI